MNSAKIQDHFQELTDPRRREVTYPLINIVVIAVCAVICRADDFVAIDGKTLRRTALSLLKNESTAKVGVKNKRLTAGWDENYLQKVLFR
ncbi:MAG: hypothetical protein Tsb009_37580 [Planctomycetaceae bacterium]